MSPTTTISGELCKKIVLQHPSCCCSSDHKTKVRIPNETADALGHLLRMFVVEARARASIEVSNSKMFGPLFWEGGIDCHCPFLGSSFLGRMRLGGWGWKDGFVGGQ